MSDSGQSPITRRRFVAGSLATGVGAAIPAAAEAKTKHRFGRRAGNPRTYFDQVWDTEIYTGGCPVGLMAPGVMVEYGTALRAPVARIHWAGTETATMWTGYMDGAVQAGRRAAGEALAAL
jgi:monoamine oxidase